MLIKQRTKDAHYSRLLTISHFSGIINFTSYSSEKITAVELPHDFSALSGHLAGAKTSDSPVRRIHNYLINVYRNICMYRGGF